MSVIWGQSKSADSSAGVKWLRVARCKVIRSRRSIAFGRLTVHCVVRHYDVRVGGPSLQQVLVPGKASSRKPVGVAKGGCAACVSPSDVS